MGIRPIPFGSAPYSDGRRDNWTHPRFDIPVSTVALVDARIGDQGGLELLRDLDVTQRRTARPTAQGDVPIRQCPDPADDQLKPQADRALRALTHPLSAPYRR